MQLFDFYTKKLNLIKIHEKKLYNLYKAENALTFGYFINYVKLSEYYEPRSMGK